jgi:hypothetical protein
MYFVVLYGSVVYRIYVVFRYYGSSLQHMATLLCCMGLSVYSILVLCYVSRIF